MEWHLSSGLRHFLLLSLATFVWFSLLWTPTHQIGYDTSIAGEHDGDAPNSSICRRALANVTNDTARCWIARHFRGCQFDSGFFPYLVFQYCTFDERIIPTVFMVLWLVVLLGAFATIADSFAVTAITTGDPDAPDEGLGLGFLLGSGLLVNTITAGLVIIIKPFKMSRRPFLKDSFFYLSAVTWSASILIRRRLYYADAIGFLVFYLIYVFTTWIGGTLFRRQKESERLRGTGNFWPPFLQRLITAFHTCSVQIKSCFFHGAKCFYPIYGCVKSVIGRKVKSSTGADQKSQNVNAVSVINALSTRYRSSDNLAISQTNLPVQLSNGTLVQGQILASDSLKPAPQNYPQTLNKPVIEITSPQVNDFSDIVTDMNEETISAADYDERTSTVADPIPMVPMNFLQPVDGPRQRASSVGSSCVDPNRRRLSSSTPGTGGLARERCRRTQSVSRRRASTRMNAVGYELPYMVRWIIANRELEEKDLGVHGDLRKSQKWLQSDTEDGRGSAYQGSNWDSRTDVYGSTFVSTAEDEGLAKPGSVATKKITLDLVPKDKEVHMFPEDEARIKEIAEIDEEVEEDQIEEKIWLAKWASKSMWHHFVYYMIPVDIEAWPETSLISKFLQILQTPLFMVFRITIPTVLEELMDETPDNEVAVMKGERIEVSRTMQPVQEEPESETEPTPKEQSILSESQESSVLDFEAMHGWCKPLNVLQCVIVPTLWPLLLTSNGRCIGLIPIGHSSVPLFVPFTLTGLAIATAVHFTSSWQLPPRLYHRPFFATLGFVTSIIWIYALAHELVNSLESLGIVWEISEAILGLSIMALASSIGEVCFIRNRSNFFRLPSTLKDIMANCLLARNGYPRIAYAACMGSPLFNLLIGAGLSYTIKIGRSGDGFANLSFTLTQALLFSCLMAVLVCNILMALIFKFQFHRPYGFILVAVYLIFVTIAILIEVDIIVSPQNWRLATGTE
ncbi:unnamed protein product [Echinostoma caproni]|uniref:Sodium/potassium/calcium exchanger 6 n=1 Tax=Echinostoma caproni TaxID=27848 RepID=A0A183A8G1_9TREM|nr:unnamed protein product [Echinostoma caproni]